MNLRNHKAVNWLNRILWVIFFIELVIFGFRAISLTNFRWVEKYGDMSGLIAALLFAMALIPGSMQRLNFGKPVYSFLIYYRRQYGLLMFLTVFFHYIARMYAIFLYNEFLEPSFDPIIIAGQIAAFILFPVVITSNNYAMKILKRNWKTVQRFTYFTYIFITWHFYLVQHWILFYFFLVLGVFVSISWIKKLLVK